MRVDTRERVVLACHPDSMLTAPGTTSRRRNEAQVSIRSLKARSSLMVQNTAGYPDACGVAALLAVASIRRRRATEHRPAAPAHTPSSLPAVFREVEAPS